MSAAKHKLGSAKIKKPTLSGFSQLLVSEQGLILWCSESAKTLLGLEAQNLLALPLSRLLCLANEPANPSGSPIAPNLSCDSHKEEPREGSVECLFKLTEIPCYLNLITLDESQSFFCRLEKIPLHQPSEHAFLLSFLQEGSAENELAYQQESELNKLQKRLTESNALIERLTYLGSHDLQEPIRMVTSYSQRLSKSLQGQLSPQQQKYLSYVVDGAERARAMISDLLVFSRLDRPAEKYSEVQLGDICQEVKLALAEHLEQSKGQLSWDDELPSLLAIRSQLVQMLMNFASNGLKFNQSPRPKVHISCTEQQQSFRISIQDNGIGIDAKHQGSIFGLFQRLHSKRAYPGTGLGLAICQKIAHQNGAQITLQSQAEKGSTFFVTWPKLQLDSLGDANRKSAPPNN